MSEPVRVAVCASSAMMRLCVATVLARACEVGYQTEVVAEFGPADALHRRRFDSSPAVIILDDHRIVRLMTLMDGAVPVVVSNGDVDGTALWEGLRAGIKCFVSVDTDLDALPRTCHLAVAGSGYLSPPLVNTLVAHLAEGSAKASIRYGLTSRELQVLRLLCDGRRAPEIGQLLRIKPRTVKYHLSSLYRKLGVRSASDAIVLAYRDGLVA